MAVVAILVGMAVGHAFGGIDKGFVHAHGGRARLWRRVVIFIDRTMQSWSEYS